MIWLLQAAVLAAIAGAAASSPAEDPGFPIEPNMNEECAGALYTVIGQPFGEGIINAEVNKPFHVESLSGNSTDSEVESVCGIVGASVWFTLEGDGRALVASNCCRSAPRVSVLRGGSCDDLECVAHNANVFHGNANVIGNRVAAGCPAFPLCSTEAGETDLGAAVRWVTEPGVTYYIVVSNDQAAPQADLVNRAGADQLANSYSGFVVYEDSCLATTALEMNDRLGELTDFMGAMKSKMETVEEVEMDVEDVATTLEDLEAILIEVETDVDLIRPTLAMVIALTAISGLLCLGDCCPPRFRSFLTVSRSRGVRAAPGEAEQPLVYRPLVTQASAGVSRNSSS